MDSILQTIMPQDAIDAGVRRLRINEVKEYFKKVAHSDVMKIPPVLLEDRFIEDIYQAFQEVYANEIQARSCEYYQSNGVYIIRTFGTLD